MNRHVIIVAGGKGLRMGGDIPKQFLPVGGKPVLMRTIEAFCTFLTTEVSAQQQVSFGPLHSPDSPRASRCMVLPL